MTRKRKSRKVINNGTARLSKDKLRELRAIKEQRTKKKKKGAQAGNRNSQLLKVETTESTSRSSADKRTGSKTPIDLTPVAAKPVQQPKVRKDLKPQAVLSTYKEPELTPEQELEQLESDERFLALIERHDNGEILQGKDAKYFNAKVDRHQKLCEILGLDDDDFEDDEDMLDGFMNDSLADEWLDDEDEK